MCDVSGCDQKVYCKGFCRAHYNRMTRHGDPLGGLSRAKRGAPRKWLLEHVSHNGDDCLIWPFFRVEGRGYGRIERNFAHREMCILAHGEPPDGKPYATHSCGNGHGGCVNPKHLVWGSAKKNAQDKFIHGSIAAGERNGGCKLHWKTVSKIRKLAGTRGRPGAMTQQAVADMVGVGQSQISAIVRGRSW